MLQMKSISALENCDVALAIDHHRTFRQEAIELDHPLRIWHAMCFDSLIAFDQGRWQSADLLSERAYRYGFQHDLQQAFTVRQAQHFAGYVALERLPEISSRLAPILDEVLGSTLGRSTYALTLAGSDRDREALDLAREEADLAIERFRSSSIPSLAILAPLVARAADETLVRQIRDVLLPFADLSIVVGFGVRNLGPLWRYLAPLATSREEQVDWLERALERSRTLGSTTWTVLNGRRLVDATGDAPLGREIELLASGSDIGLLPRPGRRPDGAADPA
jgi:hypothetical protein